MGQPRKASTLKLSPGSIRRESGCSPSTRGGLTRAPTQTGRDSTREAGRWSGQKCWKRSTRRSWTNGTREPNLDFLSGSEGALVKRPELQTLQRARKTRLRVQLPRKCRRRRRMKTMMRRKSNANNIDHSNVSTTKNKNHVRKKKKKNMSQKKKKKKKKKK